MSLTAWALVVGMALANGADIRSTHAAMSRGCEEAVLPIHNFAGIVVYKSAIGVGLIINLHNKPKSRSAKVLAVSNIAQSVLGWQLNRRCNPATR